MYSLVEGNTSCLIATGISDCVLNIRISYLHLIVLFTHIFNHLTVQD